MNKFRRFGYDNSVLPQEGQPIEIVVNEYIIRGIFAADRADDQTVFFCHTDDNEIVEMIGTLWRPELPRCPACGGNGYIDTFRPDTGHDTPDCERCKGTGEVPADEDDVLAAEGDYLDRFSVEDYVIVEEANWPIMYRVPRRAWMREAFRQTTLPMRTDPTVSLEDEDENFRPTWTWNGRGPNDG